MDQGHRRPITNCAINLFLGIIQIQEPMPSKALEPDRRIEAFRICVVGRLPWSAEVQRDPV